MNIFKTKKCTNNSEDSRMADFKKSSIVEIKLNKRI